jgi:hypothetical protein
VPKSISTDAPAAIAHHVLRLHVAMQQAAECTAGQRLADLGAEQRRLAGAEAAPAAG